MTVVWFIAGLVLLVGGAELLVRGAAALARAAGISSLVVGLTVVAFGTSSPEMAVSVEAGLAGNGDIAVGNVVGSNSFNVLFILGVSALVAPLVVSRQLLRQDIPIMVAISLLPIILGWDGRISAIEGGISVLLLVVYTVWLIRQSRRAGAVPDAPDAEAPLTGGPAVGWRGMALNLALAIGGLVILVLGARWLVYSAVVFAEAAGVDKLIIGLTIVAAGTSLPEVATSLIAAFRGQRDIAVGNVVGSNIFNLLGILGLAATLAPGGLAINPSLLRLDVPVMFGAALACLPICFTGGRITRSEGLLLLGGYVAYTVYLVLNARQHPLLEPVGTILAWVLLPLAGLVLAGTAILQLRRQGLDQSATAQGE